MYAKFQGREIQTEPVTAQGEITPIMQEWWLPLQWPLAADRLLIAMYDHDTAKSHEIVGTMFFSLKDLVAKG